MIDHLEDLNEKQIKVLKNLKSAILQNDMVTDNFLNLLKKLDLRQDSSPTQITYRKFGLDFIRNHK